MTSPALRFILPDEGTVGHQPMIAYYRCCLEETVAQSAEKPGFVGAEENFNMTQTLPFIGTYAFQSPFLILGWKISGSSRQSNRRWSRNAGKWSLTENTTQQIVAVSLRPQAHATAFASQWEFQMPILR